MAGFFINSLVRLDRTLFPLKESAPMNLVLFHKDEDNRDNDERENRRSKEAANDDTAMLDRVSEPAVMDRAVGNIPTIIVKVVIKIGRSRTRPASMTALRGSMPRPIKVSV